MLFVIYFHLCQIERGMKGFWGAFIEEWLDIGLVKFGEDESFVFRGDDKES